MRVFLLAGGINNGQTLRIVGADYHYLSRVLRLGKGDLFQGTDGRGRAWRLRVVAMDSDSLQAAIEENVLIEETEYDISLYQALPKGRKMELIVRQATELGVRRIVPVLSEHSLVKVTAAEADLKRQRWQRIAREALQQSGAARLPQIEQPIGLTELLEKDDLGRVLFFHQDRLAAGSLHACLAEAPNRVSLLIGPEGGFSGGEVDRLLDSGFTPVYLGDTVLRSETAALAALAAVKMILQERANWKLSE